MTVTAISISRTGHRQKSEQQQQQQKQASYKLPTLVPCAPTRTMCTHSYLAHPLVPCAPTRTLYPPTRTLHTNSNLVPRLVPCAPTHTLCTDSYLVQPAARREPKRISIPPRNASPGETPGVCPADPDNVDDKCAPITTPPMNSSCKTGHHEILMAHPGSTF